MLCLSRRKNSGIQLTNRQTGEVILIQVIRHTADSCRLGIEADRDQWEIERVPQVEENEFNHGGTEFTENTEI